MGVAFSEEKTRERFWQKVQKTATCWIWVGQKNGHGYGVVDTRRSGTRVVAPAHRRAWEMTFGPIPKGIHVLHECDNPACVRPGPGHLHLGTHAENMAEMKSRHRAAREWRKPNTKISDAAARTIRESKENGRVLARRHGVSEQTICDIRKGRTRQRA